MTKRHTHKYYKAYQSTGVKSFLWTCALPDCTHHMPKHYEKSIHGKISLCFRCDDEIILDPVRLNMDKPLCDDCIAGVEIIKEKDNEVIDENDPIAERLNRLL